MLPWLWVGDTWSGHAVTWPRPLEKPPNLGRVCKKWYRSVDGARWVSPDGLMLFFMLLPWWPLFDELSHAPVSLRVRASRELRAPMHHFWSAQQPPLQGMPAHHAR